MAITQTPHLVVMREVNEDDGTDLHEFWRLQRYTWVEPPIEDPPLDVYVAPWIGDNDTCSNGLPPSDSRAKSTCNWSEAPQEIRDGFVEQIENLQKLSDSLTELDT